MHATPCLQIGTLFLAVILCCCVDARVPDEEYSSLHYRDETEPSSLELERPVKQDGLGSLLLKNLRFRDVARASRQLQPLQWLLKSNRPDSMPSSYGNRFRDNAEEFGKEKPKREVSVSQLAQLLNSLKSRSVDDNGVKLPSLRFGK